MNIKVLLVDDNNFYRQGFKLMLERFPFVSEVIELSSGIEFLEQVLELNPDITFMDIKMPDMDGIEATKKAIFLDHHQNIIALTMFGDDGYLHEMIKAGAKGYLLKDSSVDEIESAIISVMSNKYYCSKRVVKKHY